jgi:hypothetical protein
MAYLSKTLNPSITFAILSQRCIPRETQLHALFAREKLLILRKVQDQPIVVGQVSMRSAFLGHNALLDDLKYRPVALGRASKRNLKQIQGLVRLEVNDLRSNVSGKISSSSLESTNISRFLDGEAADMGNQLCPVRKDHLYVLYDRLALKGPLLYVSLDSQVILYGNDICRKSVWVSLAYCQSLEVEVWKLRSGSDGGWA